MTIRVVCQCGKSYRVMVEHAGKVTKCKACGAPIQIPTVSEVGEQQTSQIPVGTIVTDDSPKPAPPKKRPPLPKNVADQWYGTAKKQLPFLLRGIL
jgi:hypothetical protein